MNDEAVLGRLRGGLIVSCQADAGTPLDDPRIIAALALSAQMGGAVGVRADGPRNIEAIRRVCALPMVGIYKRPDLSRSVYITPDLPSAEAVIQAGADIVALDGTQRVRPGKLGVQELIKAIKERHGVLVMADVATYDEGVGAADWGADLVATTLSGYTEGSRSTGPGPDLELVGALSRSLSVPVIAEGRISTPEHAREALRRGAFAVVVGTAITNPQKLTARFVEAIGRGAASVG